MMDQVKEILDMVTGSGVGVADIIGILSVVAALTPTPKDDMVLVVLRKVLNLGAMNIWQAENKNKPGEH